MDVLKLLRTAVKLGASDLHVHAGAPPAVRVDGRIKLLRAPALPSTETAAFVAEIAKDETRSTFRRTVEGLGTFRVTVFTAQGRSGASVRVIAPPQTPDELSLSPHLVALLQRPSGLLLLTGTAGAGTTTTLHALVDQLNQRTRSTVVCIEDPVERIHSHKHGVVVPLGVGPDVPDIASGLELAMRMDADVLALSDLPDLESVQLAMMAAEAGHLVLVTLHFATVQDTIGCLLDAWSEGRRPAACRQLATTLLGIHAQRLLPRANGGRVLASEFLVSTESVRQAIRSDELEAIPQAMTIGRRVGMSLMDHTIRRLLRDEIITLETARASVRDPRVIADT